MARVSPASVPAAATGGVPHYGGAAVVTGSLIFLALLAVGVALAYFRCRR